MAVIIEPTLATHCEREWLNPSDHSSTGSVVAFYGDNPFQQKDSEASGPYAYLEVADCHQKARLHLVEVDSIKDFIEKLKKLRDVIDRFIAFLEKQKV